MDVVAVCLTQQIPKKCVPAISLYEADVSNKRSNSTIEMTQWVVATPCDKPSQAIISFNACQVIHVPCPDFDFQFLKAQLPSYLRMRRAQTI